ncbi:MAG: alpha-amylase family glycosyl hydrolase [Verrucomicrobiales bacterium]|nr:alpha-amylase family glycosyl hydrolase [Verrucomicrobiales bacterium]
MVISDHQCETTLNRLKLLLEKRYPDSVRTPEWEGFMYRLEESFPTLLGHLLELYGHHFDFYYHLERLLEVMADAWLERPPDWKSTDAMREADRTWYKSGHLIAAMAYVDLFSDDIKGLQEQIPYLKEMGITYLHLMPIYQSPEGDDDGGYAVSSYRDVDPELGNIDDLRILAEELRRQGISLVLDFVFNHTSDEHEWARRAFEGNEAYQDFYLMFDTRQETEEYQRQLRAIFPDERPGNFTYLTRLKKWVWTTFHSYQWDLNYRNPEVFNAMAGEMLFLANVGVEVLRMDAVPFVWKQKGTNCENLPEAHTIIEAFSAIAGIVAPSMVFKSEAIVAPDEIKKYIGTDQCQISYNPLLMALLWEGIATRNARLLRTSMEKRFDIPEGCAWVNYVRSHDDIGWGFDDGDAYSIGINPNDHRRFLTNFFVGRHEASFAEGEPFQEDPETGDARVCGTTASLCGLGKALELGDAEEIELALRRILLLHGVSFTIGGIPLIYLGEEIGMLNDPSYKKDLDKEGDERWLHRPKFDWEKAAKRTEAGTIEHTLYEAFLKLTRLRLNNIALARGETEIIDPGNDHVFAYFRTSAEQSILCLANFSDQDQSVPASRLRQLGLKKVLTDIIAGQTVIAAKSLELEPHQFMVLLRQGG